MSDYFKNVVHVCQEKKSDTLKVITLNFRKTAIMDRILSGEKTIETRALNPLEKNRFFGDVHEGDCMIFDDLEREQKYLVRVLHIHRWDNLQNFAQDTENFIKTC